ncbi:MAG: hypothetical protein PVH29_10805 [Candidatus Zixiibacteriota bacterium]|jgi:hypothetical protein
MKYTAIIIGSLFIAVATWGAWGDVIGSFPAPGGNPVSLTWDGQYLWCSTQHPEYTYRVNPDNGSVISSYATGFAYAARGLAWADSSIYEGNNSTNRIYKRATSGSIASSFPVTNYYGGLTYDGTNLWVTSSTSTTANVFSSFTLAGSLLGSFTVDFVPFDPGWDGTYLYCGSYSPTHTIYQLTTTGSVVSSVSPPHNFPWGCCCGGNYLWISTTAGSDLIWKLDSGFTGVAPASVGRVKALFQ